MIMLTYFLTTVDTFSLLSFNLILLCAPGIIDTRVRFWLISRSWQRETRGIQRAERDFVNARRSVWRFGVKCRKNIGKEMVGEQCLKLQPIGYQDTCIVYQGAQIYSVGSESFKDYTGVDLLRFAFWKRKSLQCLCFWKIVYSSNMYRWVWRTIFLTP